jgi:hypothetical protein
MFYYKICLFEFFKKKNLPTSTYLVLGKKKKANYCFQDISIVYLIVDHFCLTVYFKAKILIVIFDFSASLHISYNRH